MPTERTTRQEQTQCLDSANDSEAGRPVQDTPSAGVRPTPASLFNAARTAVERLDINQLAPLLALHPELARWKMPWGMPDLANYKTTLLLCLAQTAFGVQPGRVKKGLACLDALLPLSNLQARDPWGHTALVLMMKNGNAKGFDRLLAVVGPEKPDDHRLEKAKKGMDESPLMTAAGEGRTHYVKALLKAKANVHAVDKKKRNALMLAIQNRHPQCIDLLLPHCDPTVEDRKGNTALFYAVQNTDAQVVQQLRQLAKSAKKPLPDMQKSVDWCLWMLRGLYSTTTTDLKPTSPLLSITDGFSDVIQESEGVEIVRRVGAEKLPQLAARMEQLELQRELGLPACPAPGARPSHDPTEKRPATVELSDKLTTPGLRATQEPSQQPLRLRRRL